MEDKDLSLAFSHDKYELILNTRHLLETVVVSIPILRDKRPAAEFEAYVLDQFRVALAQAQASADTLDYPRAAIAKLTNP